MPRPKLSNMRYSGDIYHIYRSDKSGEVRIGLSRLEKSAYRLVRSVGAGMIGFAVILFIFTFGPVIREEIIYSLDEEGIPYRQNGFESLIDKAEADRVVDVQQEAQNYDVSSYFSIVIPKIEATSNVIANVDASDEEQYFDALQKGVAHARGTYFPGQGKNIYLFSHSTDANYNVTRYNAIFYLLKKLEKNDKIIIFFADEKYEYEVVEKVTTSANDTSWLSEKRSEEILILQTCDPPGTNWRRLLVIARPVD
jgi:LPXTG-site transpeptidase (sortase) family protein